MRTGKKRTGKKGKRRASSIDQSGKRRLFPKWKVHRTGSGFAPNHVHDLVDDDGHAPFSTRRPPPPPRVLPHPAVTYPADSFPFHRRLHHPPTPSSCSPGAAADDVRVLSSPRACLPSLSPSTATLPPPGAAPPPGPPAPRERESWPDRRVRHRARRRRPTTPQTCSRPLSSRATRPAPHDASHHHLPMAITSSSLLVIELGTATPPSPEVAPAAFKDMRLEMRTARVRSPAQHEAFGVPSTARAEPAAPVVITQYPATTARSSKASS